ncbi:uncharacterized protein LOC130689939 isoform X2 [Daphnia carinata]|uniref:uncharacterized protein LOC130689939 isoform X2 n=1 Tax=Daphnia carinata TaxID=120202 RepID=UPI00257C2BED|nr:uncharacterized protein LOC130689939 isoform X2 [Daphnia carinata]
MAVIQLLQLLLTLHLLMIVSAGTNVNRQLDIPAFQSFFSQASSQRSKDDVKTKINTGSVVSSELEGPPVSSEVGVNDTLANNENLIPIRDSKSGTEVNHVNVPRITELRNVSGYQQPSSSLIKGGFSPSLPIPSTVLEKKGQDFEFKPMLNSSSHGSTLLNNARVGGTPNQYTAFGGKSELIRLRPDQPISVKSSNFRAISSRNHPTTSSVTQSSKVASTRAISNHKYVNTHTVPAKTVNYNDWIPISPPIQLTVTSLNSQTVTNKPPSSKGLLQSTTSSPSTTTLKREEYKIEETENKTKEKVQFGSSPVTASNGDVREVDNDSNPSFLRGFSFKKPSTPLYGQVLYPPRKYAPAKRPITKYASKIPVVSVPPKNVGEIIAGGAGAQPPIQPVHQPVHQYNPPPGQRPFKPLVNVPHTTMNSGYGLSENSLNGNGGVKEVTNVGFANPFQPIKTNSSPELPTLRQFSGPVNGNPPHSPIQTNFDDGYVDDVGTVSSFSYFRNLESEISGPKGFDNAFSIHAGRNIAKEFNKNMFDHTGFPGNGQSAKSNKNHGISGGKY